MAKPKLPQEVVERLPQDIVRYIYSYIPHLEKKKASSVSPQMQKDLLRIQHMNLRGKKDTYLRELEDFLLD